MNFFDHKDLGNHLLQLCPKAVKHPVYIYIYIYIYILFDLNIKLRRIQRLCDDRRVVVHMFWHNSIIGWLITHRVITQSGETLREINCYCAGDFHGNACRQQ